MRKCNATIRFPRNSDKSLTHYCCREEGHKGKHRCGLNVGLRGKNICGFEWKGGKK
jgi:hypothetical protein